MTNAGSKRTIRTIRTRRSIKKYTYLGCPMTRNRSAWCFRLCPPDAHGHGRCGRVAPHSLKGRTQLAIEAYNKRQHKDGFPVGASRTDPHGKTTSPHDLYKRHGARHQ